MKLVFWPKELGWLQHYFFFAVGIQIDLSKLTDKELLGNWLLFHKDTIFSYSCLMDQEVEIAFSGKVSRAV